MSASKEQQAQTYGRMCAVLALLKNGPVAASAIQSHLKINRQVYYNMKEAMLKAGVIEECTGELDTRAHYIVATGKPLPPFRVRSHSTPRMWEPEPPPAPRPVAVRVPPPELMPVIDTISDEEIAEIQRRKAEVDAERFAALKASGRRRDKDRHVVPDTVRVPRVYRTPSTGRRVA